MNTEQRLALVADRYRDQGFRVVIRPGPDALPSFAKDFKVEILAERAGGNVLASAKGSPSEFGADVDLSKYAEAIEKQPGWRYDIHMLGPAPRVVRGEHDAEERSEEEIRQSLDDAELMLKSSFVSPAFMAAWAAMESAMRLCLRAEGGGASRGTSPRTMLNELLSLGVLSNGEFRDLESLFRLRNIIVHGFSAPALEPRSVLFLVGLARRLLADRWEDVPVTPAPSAAKLG